MIKQKVESALNGQMNKEFYSYYLYLSMAAHFESNNLKGFGHWLRIQAREEAEHAMKLYEYLISRGGKVILQPIEAPPSNWKAHKDVFQDAYQHEQKVTGLITKLVELAKSEKDHPTEVFLHWFVKEQVEEEAIAHEVLQKLQLVGSEGSALFILDSELGKRASAGQGPN
jgi:ferritin